MISIDVGYQTIIMLFKIIYIATVINRIAKIVVSIFLGAIAANFVSSIPPPMPAIMKSKAITHSI